MRDESRIITIAVDAEMLRRLKEAAANRGVSVEQLCYDTIQMRSCEPGFAAGLVYWRSSGDAPKPDFAKIFARCDEITGGQPTGDPDAATLIREIREERMRDIERAIKGYDDADSD